MDRGAFLKAQAENIRATAVVHNAQLPDVIVDGSEWTAFSARPGTAPRIGGYQEGSGSGIGKLDCLNLSVKDRCKLQERFERPGGSLNLDC